MKKFLVGILSALMLVAVGLVPAKAIIPDEELVGTYTYDFTTYDNGMNGLWAVDTFHSTVKIYQLEQSNYDYKVVREDSGTFEVLPGAKSPGGDGESLVGDGTKGTISGGETAFINGTLKDIPSSVGPIDWTSDERSDEWFDLEDLSRLQSPPYYEPFFDDTENGRGDVTEWGWTYVTCNNGTWVDTEASEEDYYAEVPEGIMGDITGEYVPCATPTTDVCANIDGDQSGVPDGLHLDASGQNCVAFQFGGAPPPPAGAVLAGQVLGATTLGATGGVEENIFLALFALGSILVGTGVRKLGVPRE